ncbi:MAG: DNA methyltransferase [Candidatus Caldatribacteriaceae bacterium]
MSLEEDSGLFQGNLFPRKSGKKKYHFERKIPGIHQKRLDFQSRTSDQNWTSRPFPVEPPYRLISLSTFEREVVLDPFMGSQTGIAALQMKRHDVGYETNRGYVRLAERRLREFSFSRKVPRLFDLGKNRLSK